MRLWNWIKNKLFKRKVVFTISDEGQRFLNYVQDKLNGEEFIIATYEEQIDETYKALLELGETPGLTRVDTMKHIVEFFNLIKEEAIDDNCKER